MGAWECKKNVRQGGKERKERLRKRELGNGKKVLDREGRALLDREERKGKKRLKKKRKIMEWEKRVRQKGEERKERQR